MIKRSCSLEKNEIFVVFSMRHMTLVFLVCLLLMDIPSIITALARRYEFFSFLHPNADKFRRVLSSERLRFTKKSFGFKIFSLFLSAKKISLWDNKTKYLYHIYARVVLNCRWRWLTNIAYLRTVPSKKYFGTYMTFK